MLKKQRILIVDDDKDFADGLAEVLEIEDHLVTVVHDGEAAVDAFRKNDYDITFMDVKLPGKNGVESFFSIRTLKPDARVVMMTGYSVNQLLQQAVEGGAWDILYKPLDMEAVLRIVEKAEKCLVLVADDDADFADGIREALVMEGYQVTVVSEGRQALSVLDACKVDVLILDLRMPIMGGIDTILQMKQKKCLIPTIIVTAYAKEEADTIDAIGDMACSILKKPFDPAQLIAAIRNLR